MSASTPASLHPEVEIRRAEPGDLPGILELLKAALGETPLLRRSPDLWRWKHADNPFGPSLVLVAVAEERVVGVRALMRWELVGPSGERLRCLRAVDTATHPEFTRRGIFRNLTTAAVEEARALGFDLIFNTPNAKSGPGYLSMGWKPVGRVGVLARPRLIGASHPGSGLARVDEYLPDVWPVEPALEDRPPRGWRTPRTIAYQRWRFLQHPTARYGMVQRNDATAIVRANLRSGRPELVLSDLLGRADPAPVRAIARRHRARYLAGWFSPGSPERRAAIRAGLVPLPVTTLRLVARPLRADLEVGDLSRWDLATSDLELL